MFSACYAACSLVSCLMNGVLAANLAPSSILLSAVISPAVAFDDFADNVEAEARTRDTGGAMRAEIGLKQHRRPCQCRCP
jgi:hypothetical protein